MNDDSKTPDDGRQETLAQPVHAAGGPPPPAAASRNPYRFEVSGDLAVRADLPVQRFSGERDGVRAFRLPDGREVQPALCLKLVGETIVRTAACLDHRPIRGAEGVMAGQLAFTPGGHAVELGALRGGEQFAASGHSR